MIWHYPSNFYFLHKIKTRVVYLGSKYVIPVMDEDPPHPPSRNKPAFGQATTGKDGNVTAEGCQGSTVASWEYLRTKESQPRWNKTYFTKMFVPLLPRVWHSGTPFQDFILCSFVQSIFFSWKKSMNIYAGFMWHSKNCHLKHFILTDLTLPMNTTWSNMCR